MSALVPLGKPLHTDTEWRPRQAGQPCGSFNGGSVSGRQRALIGLVVPALELSGGVPAVAAFICRAALRADRFDIQLISLSSSAVDDLSVAITRPGSWLTGVQSADGVWGGRPFVRIGAFASELEFQRYRPRTALTNVLSCCDLIQVVCGSPAWANAVIGLSKPVALQVATQARLDRRLRDAN